MWKTGELWKLGGPTEDGIAALIASPSAPERAGVFDRERFLKLLRHFVVFEEDRDSGQVYKILAGYHLICQRVI